MCSFHKRTQIISFFGCVSFVFTLLFFSAVGILKCGCCSKEGYRWIRHSLPSKLPVSLRRPLFHLICLCEPLKCVCVKYISRSREFGIAEDSMIECLSLLQTSVTLVPDNTWHNISVGKEKKILFSFVETVRRTCKLNKQNKSTEFY